MIAQGKKVNASAGLTVADVQRFANDRSEDSRRLLALHLGASYSAGLTPGERSLADEIVRVMVRDVAPMVRAALSTSLRFSNDLPMEVARQLANDVAEVAIPMLSASELLGDNDLIEIVRAQGMAHREAIAARRSVSKGVSEVLVDCGDVAVISRLVANPGASFTEPLLERVVDRYGRHEEVATPLADRADLSIVIAERLMTVVSAELARRNGVEVPAAPSSREWLLLDPEGELRDLGELLWRLMDEYRVGLELLPAAAAAGEREIVEILLARFSDMSLARVRTMLTVRAGQDALFDAVQMPQGARKAVRRLYSAPA